MKKMNFLKSKFTQNYWLLMLIILILASINIQNTQAQCTGECAIEPEYYEQLYTVLPFQNEATLVTVGIMDGVAYYQGDIVLGTINELLSQEDDVLNGVAIDGNSFRWANAVIPYEIGNFSNADIQKINNAAQHISENTNLCVIPRTNETDYVFVRPANSGCSAVVGKRGGKQYITLSSGCSFGSTVHEFLHAAGVYHEQSRSDRDQYVNINFSNVKAGFEHNFQKRESNASDYGPYNFESIMHYGNFAFRINSQIPTITTIPPGTPIGQRNGLSPGDILTLNSIYPNACGTPDLVITNCGFGSISATTISLIGIEVKNIGTATSNSNELAMYLSKDENYSVNDYFVGTTTVGSLSAGELKSIAFETYPTAVVNNLPSEKLNIILVVDDKNMVAESNENNNTCTGNSFGVAAETCNDGIKNGDEEGVDCGGSCSTACTVLSDCEQRDRTALIALYNATDGPNWTNKWNLNEPIANWHGIALNDDGCVRMINLGSNKLSGKLPAAIGNLSELTYVRLSSNSLTGSIPIAISNLTKLRSLFLSGNQLNGQIPFEMINMVSLKNLRLHNNQFTGVIPETLAGLPLLTEFSVYNNQLSGCFGIRLELLCNQLTDFYNSNTQISNGNNFDITWEAFCNGESCNTTPPPQPEIITCLTFDGKDDYVQISNKPATAIATRDFTFEAWIEGQESQQTFHPVIFSNRKTSTTGGFMFFFHGKWGGSQYKMLSVQLDGKNHQIINNGTFNGSLLDGNCHHVAVTLNGQTLSFYADGELFGTKTVPGNPNISSTVPLWLGADQLNGKRFKGSISQVRMWKAARSKTQIQNNMHKSISGSTANLVSYWEMDEYEGQRLNDKTGLANGRLGSSAGADGKDPQWLRAGQCCFNPDGLRSSDFLVNGASIQSISVEQNQPNPAKDFTSITYSTINETKATALKIYNVTGKLMKQFDLDNSNKGNIIVNVKDMQPGLYLYTISANDGSSVTNKMMIQQ